MKCYYSIQWCFDAGFIGINVNTLRFLVAVHRTTENSGLSLSRNFQLYYCIKDDKGFVTRFIWMCRCRFVVNRQTKKDRKNSIRGDEKRQKKKCKRVYNSMVCSTNPKWYWRLICKLRYSDYSIRDSRIYVEGETYAMCHPKIQKKNILQKINYEQNWILRNLKPCPMNNEQESNIWFDNFNRKLLQAIEQIIQHK